MLRSLYILSNSRWEDIVPYIQAAESKGYKVTNTMFRNCANEMSIAECVLCLRGYNETKEGRELHEMAISMNKTIISRMQFVDDTIEEQKQLKIMAQYFTRREVRQIISILLGCKDSTAETHIQDTVRFIMSKQIEERKV